MTPSQQTQYWRKYAKQNAKMERLAFFIMRRAMKTALGNVVNSLNEYGAEVTLQNLESLVPRSLIKQAYEELYMKVGVKHKAWTDADVKERFPAKKSMLLKEDEDERLRRRPNPERVRIGANLEVGFFNPAWLGRLKQIVNNIDVLERVASVASTIAKDFRKSISNAQQQFVSITKIKARLREDFSELSVRRAETIARTEVTYINNIAAEQSAAETGLDLVKVWIHTRDDRTRDAHRNVSTKPIKSTEKFLVGGVRMDKPGDPAGGLRNIINCRCAVSYLPADDYEDLEF